MPFSFSMIGGLAGDLLAAGRRNAGPGGQQRDKDKVKAARKQSRVNRRKRRS